MQRVAAVRDAVGPDVAIRLDANQGWTREEAVQVIRALEVADLGVEFVEQPVVADDVEGLAWVRERVGLPVMADESCYGPFDLERIIRLGAADLVNVKLAKCGSLTVGRDMLRRAHDAGLRTIVGSMMESHVGVGAAAALVAAEPTTEVSDLDAAWWSVRSPVDRRNRLRRQPDSRAHVGGLRDHGFRSGRLTDRCTTKGPAGAGPFVRAGRGQLPTTRSVKVPSPLPVVEELTPTARRDSRNVLASPSTCPWVELVDLVEVDEERDAGAADVADGQLEGVAVARACRRT